MAYALSQKAVAEAAAGALTPRSLPPKKKPTTPSVRLAPGVWAGERIQLVSPKKMARDVPHHEVLTDQTENGLSHLQQRQGSNGPMPQSRIEASSEGVLRRGQIPRTFLITDKAWSARVDKLNRSLARTHPGWPVLFFDDDMAEEFVKHHYPNMPYAKVFHQFRIPAHRADFFRYAALHAQRRAPAVSGSQASGRARVPVGALGAPRTAAAGGSPRQPRGTLEGAQRAVHRRRLRPTTPRRCGSSGAALVARRRSPARWSSHTRSTTACKGPRARGVVQTPEPHSGRAMGAALTRPTSIASASTRSRACGV